METCLFPKGLCTKDIYLFWGGHPADIANKSETSTNLCFKFPALGMSMFLRYRTNEKVLPFKVQIHKPKKGTPFQITVCLFSTLSIHLRGPKVRPTTLTLYATRSSTCVRRLGVKWVKWAKNRCTSFEDDPKQFFLPRKKITRSIYNVSRSPDHIAQQKL